MQPVAFAYNQQQEAGMALPIFMERIRIKQFGCVQDVDLKLSPIHALIGPNDSGKSTILRAVRTAMQLLCDKFSGGFEEFHPNAKCEPFHPGLHENAEIKIGFSNQLAYRLAILGNENIQESMSLPSGEVNQIKRRIWEEPKDTRQFLKSNLPKQMRGSPRLVRLDPDSLRQPGNLIPSSQTIDLQEKGIGLASVFDALMNRNIDGYISIRENMRKLFPTTASIGLKNVSINTSAIGKILELELKTGARVPSSFMSEGMLYYMAYAALQYLEPASLILVEEPENGLHPSRIKEIMDIIKELSNTTQVLIATHSPLVINELQPEEVTVVWRDEKEGTKVVPIKETKNFEERSKIYALGELWLSYADGISEKPLREGPR
jgi:predicted ATPase